MGTTRAVAWMAAALLLTGCASNQPQYENTKAPGVAEIRGSSPSPVRLFQGEAYARIEAVDGFAGPRGMTPEIYLAPGRHRLTLHFDNVGRESTIQIEADVEQGKLYRVAAERVNNTFVVQVLEETGADAGRQQGARILQTVEDPVHKNIPVVVPIVVR